MITVLRFFICLTIKINFIYSIVIENKMDTGKWDTLYEYQFPFEYEGNQYLFAGGSADRSWVTRRIDENAKLGTEDMNKGRFNYSYEKMFPIYGYNDKFYVFCIFGKHFWTIEEIYPLENMGSHKRRDSGCYYLKPIIVSSYKDNGRVYVVIVGKGGNQWYIREFLNHGKFGPETGNGSWKKNCKLGLTYYVEHQYFYCISQNNTWFTTKVLSNSKMGDKEEASGTWNTSHLYYAPIMSKLQEKYYIVVELPALKNSQYMFFEAQPSGNILETKAASGDKGAELCVFAFNIKEKAYVYRMLKSIYSYRIFSLNV